MKLYVPNPQMWVDFFDRVSTGKASLNQSGAGSRPRIITLNQSKPTDDKQVPIKAVLPAEQTVAQAKSELEREDINPASIVNMIKKGSRRGTKRKSSGASSRSKRQRGAGKHRQSVKKRQFGAGKKRRVQKKSSGKRDIFEI